MLLSEPAQWNAASIRILLPKFSTAQQTVHQAHPDLLFPFLALGARARARRRSRGLAGRYRCRYGGILGVNPQEQVLHLRRWVQKGPGCYVEIETASVFPGHSLP